MILLVIAILFKLAFMIDGGEHIGSNETSKRDRVKEKICKQYGIKLIRIANSQVKDYEMIIAIFEMTVKNIQGLEQTVIQGNLFDQD